MSIGVNIKKTLNFFKANGLSATVYEIKGRLSNKKAPYAPETPNAETMEMQKKASLEFPYRPLISILIPLYNSDRKMLEQLLISIFKQTYDNFEVVLVDGSADSNLGEFVRHFVPDPGKISYTHLAENGGISKNTNRAIEMAKGEYMAFADHDDVLEPDALFEVVRAINEHLAQMISDESIPEDVDVKTLLPTVIYTDEDKCDETGKVFYDKVVKPDYDPLYLLSNNYICHMTVIKGDVVKKLMLRPDFDGAQDQDILLRTLIADPAESQVTGSGVDQPEAYNSYVLHIPRVLYHWRVAGNSTSGNTSGKRYAYEAGRKAAEEALRRAGINAECYQTMHVGVYGIDFKEDMLARDAHDLSGFEKLGINAGALGGIVVKGKKNGKVISVPFAGIPASAGGPHNRRFIIHETPRLDLRCMKLSPALYDLFEEVTGIEYTEIPLPYKYDLSMGGDGLHCEIYEWEKIFDFERIPDDADIDALSRKLCKAIREKGYSLIYIPEWETVWK